MSEKETKESGLQRYTGIKKYGKEGFEKLQKAGREGASEEEKGKIKDQLLGKKKKTNEGLAELAGAAEQDHEVQMARAELYKIAKYAIKLHEMLKNVSEAEGIEGWQQSKITKAADYIGSVYHSLEYDQKVMTPIATEGKTLKLTMSESEVAEYKSLLEKAKSKAQQKFMGMVYAAKKGEKPASKEVAKAAKGMSKADAKDYAKTKHKGKPEHVKKK